MTLDEALKCADAASINMWSRPSETAAITLASEVRRLQSRLFALELVERNKHQQTVELRAEVTALRLYAPAQRAGAMQPPVQIAPTRWPFWMNETDEEFKAWGNTHTEAVG